MRKLVPLDVGQTHNYLLREINYVNITIWIYVYKRESICFRVQVEDISVPKWQSHGSKSVTREEGGPAVCIGDNMYYVEPL